LGYFPKAAEAMSKQNVLSRTKKKQVLDLIQTNRLKEAKPLLVGLCANERRDADLWLMLGALNGKLGLHAEATEALQQALSLRPAHAEARYNLGIALREQGQHAEAIQEFQAAIGIKPDHAEAWNSLAHAFMALNQLEEAIGAFDRALSCDPGRPDWHSNLGFVYQMKGQLEDAIRCFRSAQRLRPSLTSIQQNLGSALCAQGKHQEAIDSLRAGLRINSADAPTRSNLLLTLNYLPDQNPETMLLEHRAWGEQQGRLSAQLKSHTNSRDPNRRLRVGYVSPDFRSHSVACFIEPLLAAHDAAQIEAFCFADVARPDEVTVRLKSLAAQWRDTTRLTDAQLADLVRADNIDILVDLSGHTAGSRLRVFAYKPAPVQVTYLGYPNTTGLPAIDYRLTDAIADPVSQDVFYTEKLVRLPGCFLCYQPPIDSPAVAPLPAAATGTITFGSFNNLAKINSDVIVAWARIVTSVPGSRLLVKNPSLTDPPTRERYYEMFAEQGLPRERIDLTGNTPTRAEHLAMYGRVDIALDTFPYNGTTTTCEALWMGVPVVTLAGQIHASRVGASLLTSLNRQEWIAAEVEGYVDLARRMAGDIGKLKQLRNTLREQMQASPLCEPLAFARSIERAYREMWREWCANQQDDA
jgi:predicted O-linked N-acetylglucosamine transferase (SPINDLY family)